MLSDIRISIKFRIRQVCFGNVGRYFPISINVDLIWRLMHLSGMSRMIIGMSQIGLGYGGFSKIRTFPHSFSHTFRLSMSMMLLIVIVFRLTTLKILASIQMVDLQRELEYIPKFPIDRKKSFND